MTTTTVTVTFICACGLCDEDIEAGGTAVWSTHRLVHVACAEELEAELEAAREATLKEAREFDYDAAAANYRRLEGLSDELTQQIIDLEIRLLDIKDGLKEVLKEAEETALLDDEDEHDEWAGEAFNDAFHYYPKAN